MVEGEAHPGRAVAAAHAAIRGRIAFLEHDRALDGDVRTALALVDEGAVLAAARTVVP
jgi:histidine ammonia-lyase